MKRRIAGVHIAGLPHVLDPDRPLIVVSNHVSWWDGFLLRAVQLRLRPHAPLHSVMLQRELKGKPFLKALGAVGIDPLNPASVKRAVAVLSERMRRRPDSMVLYFPQGEIRPSHARPLGFLRGIELFARHLPSADILPIGIHLEPLNTVSPHAFISAGELRDSRVVKASELEHEVERQLDHILHFIGKHGENSAAEWPASGGSLTLATR